jgi:N-ethylmaleimide reductase
MTLADISDVIEQFRSAAVNAKEAGFDGVELHGANGYLFDQFLRDSANVRTDGYGGSIQNRARLALETTDAVISVWGPSRVGYKISPYFSNLGMSDSSPIETFSYLVKELGSRRIGYLHIAEAVSGPTVAPAGTPRATPILRRLFGGPVIANGGYNLELANAAIGSNEVDLVAFGVPFLANPDLPERWKRGAPLNAPQFDLFYTGEERGYTDYPALEQQVTA